MIHLPRLLPGFSQESVYALGIGRMMRLQDGSLSDLMLKNAIVMSSTVLVATALAALLV